MPRPMNKEDLIQASEEQFAKLWKTIEDMSKDERVATFDFGDNPKLKEAHWKRDKNIRDVLIHLYEWHMLFVDWIEANRKGEKKVFLPEEYNWRTYGDMNVAFFLKHQTTTYEEAKAMLIDSHKKVMQLVESMTNEELFSQDPFGMKGSPIGAYCTSITSSHYDWAMKKLKKHHLIYKGKAL